MAANFAITGADGVFQDTGLEIELPAAGTYLIVGDVRCRIKFSAGSYGTILLKLYNNTDAADVPNSIRKVMLYNVLNKRFLLTLGITKLLTVNGPKTIKLYAARANATTWVESDIQTDAAGWTTLAYVRIA